MPVTDDILERTRHLNDLKSMAEKTILQAFVLVLLTYTQYQFNILQVPGFWLQFVPQAANRIFYCVRTEVLLCVPS